MRFHFGVSFRLSTLKKFIFPILFGVLAYFLSSYINLGQVYALENTNTTYNLTFEEIDFSQYQTLTDKTTKQLLDDIINNYVYSTRDLVITTYFQNNSYTISIYLVPHNANIQMGVYAQNSSSYSTFYFYDNTSYTAQDGIFYYKFQANQSLSSSNSSVYQDMISCLSNASNCVVGNITEDGTYKQKVNTFHRNDIYRFNQLVNNDTSYTIPSTSQYGWVYYSSNSLVYNSSIESNNQTRFYKNLIINNKPIESQDDLPTYMDLFPLVPEPEPEPEPEPSVDHVPFSSKVYWFGEHDKTEEILENIYILLFLSFSGIFFLKAITIIKNTRW